MSSGFMRAPGWPILVPTLLGVFLSLGQDPKPEKAAPIAARQPSCSVCHPGSHKSLGRSLHARLVVADKRDRSCLECHVDGLEHETKPRELRAGSGRDACVRCHTGMSVSKERALLVSHPTKRQAREVARTTGLDPRTGVQRPLEKDPGPQIDFEGLLRVGWRFVDVDKDRRAFDHDFGLDSGPRLSELSLRALRDSDPLAEASVRGLEDREFTARAATGDGLSRRFGAEASFRRNVYVYDAEGDYHTLSNTREWTRATTHLQNEDRTRRIWFGFERLDLDGRTIGSSIGNPNQSPLVPATGVPVDRRVEQDLYRVGYEARPDWGTWSFEIAWEEAHARDELRYSRPSPANPSFTESEASSSRSSSRGPSGTLRVVAGDEDSLFTRVAVTASEHDLRVIETGALTAFDTSSFTTDTLGVGGGDRRVLALSARASHPAWSGAQVFAELDAHDVRDDVRLDLYTTTTRTSPPLVVRTADYLNLLTRVRDLELRAGVSQTFGETVDAELGWRYLDQYLSFPDLQAGDNDFQSGTVTTHGPDLRLSWRPDDVYSVHLAWSFVATDSRTPTETQPEAGQLASLRARRRLGGGNGYAELFAKLRLGENDVSSTENEYQSYGGTVSVPPWTGAQLAARAAWTSIDSRTLTNFYFAPSITPVPTLVRFRGDSWLVDLELDTPIAGGLHSLTLVSLQATEGSLDSTLLRLEEEVSYRISERISLGARLSLFEFDESRGGADDDYSARVGFLFAELRF